MSSSDESSDSGSDLEEEFYDEILFDNGNNAFAFEPEYPENEIQERLRAYITERDNIENVENVSAEPVENWCRCENCVEMENVMERVCCQSSSDIIGDKMRYKTCITLTDGFRDVCLNNNVLEAAHGTWRNFTEEPIEISNKSFRFIAYRQYISWIFVWLGKDIRKVIPSCVVNTVRNTFPAHDNADVPYKETYSMYKVDCDRR